MRRIALGFAFFCALACSDDKKPNNDDQDQEQNDGTEIGPAGGQVVADDGALTLDIPPGALSENVRISITSLGAEGGEVSFPEKPTLANYAFAPDGLTFAVPAVVTAQLPSLAMTEGGNTKVPMVIAMTYGSGAAELNRRQDLKVDLDAGSATHVTELSHFSGVGYHVFPSTLDITFEPTPPSVMTLGVNYGVGVRVSSDYIFARAFDLFYDDGSTGEIGYGGGAAPFLLKHFEVGPVDVINEVVPAYYYACLGTSTPTYAARIYVEGGSLAPPLPLLEHTCSQGCSTGNTGEAKAVAPAWPIAQAIMDVSVEITRQITCQPAAPVDPPMGPPYSGLVQLNGWNYENYASPGITGAFSDGGTEQARFDAYVAMIQSFYGTTLGGGEGSCAKLTVYDYDDGETGIIQTFLDPALIPVAKHIGTGGDDMIVAKFPAEYAASFEPTYNIYRGYIPPGSVTVGPSGVDIYAPANVASPIITLPGLAAGATSAIAFTPSTQDFPTSGASVSWQSEDLDAEFMHVVVAASGNLGLAGYACFVRPSTQVLNIDQTVIDDLLDSSWNGSPSDAHDITVLVMMVKRREVAYAGRTLAGFYVRTAEQVYYSCGEGPC